MRIAIIEVKFFLRRTDLDNILGLLPERAGYVYQIRRDDGGLHIGATCRGADEAGAINRALHVAQREGYTHYRMAGEDADPVALPVAQN